MKQLIQNFKTGELYVDELPAPSLSNAMVLVELKMVDIGMQKLNTILTGICNLNRI